MLKTKKKIGKRDNNEEKHTTNYIKLHKTISYSSVLAVLPRIFPFLFNLDTALGFINQFLNQQANLLGNYDRKEFSYELENLFKEN